MSIDYEGGFDFTQLRSDLEGVLPDALSDGGKVIRDLADSRVPVLEGEALKKANDQRRTDPGALLRSGYTRVEGETTVAVGYSEFYAGWQHERLDYHHEHGEAKFLESAFNQGSDEALIKVADRIQEGIDGGSHS